MDACPYCAASLPGAFDHCPVCGAQLGSQTLEVGTLIAGKYRVERVLGQGGFGITYLALDETLEHRVAVKELFPTGSTRKGSSVVPPPGGDFLQVKEKFLEEARVVQRFNHPNIVRVYRTFEENDTAYIVMEALDGETLGTYLTKNRALAEDTVLEIAHQLCSALEVVHAAGMIHRDVKPDNVFLAKAGRVVLIDFGSARAFAQGKAKRLTRLVTPGYAAPEQYATQATFGTYTDVYGLAATLYHAVEGKMPPSATDLMMGAKPEFRKARALRSGLEAGLKVNVGERTSNASELTRSLTSSSLERSETQIYVSKAIYKHGNLSVFPSSILIGQKEIQIFESKGFFKEIVLLEEFPFSIIQTFHKIFLNLVIFSIFAGILFLGLAFAISTIFLTIFFFFGIGMVIFTVILTFISTFKRKVPKTQFSILVNETQAGRLLELELLTTESESEINRLETALKELLPRLSR